MIQKRLLLSYVYLLVCVSQILAGRYYVDDNGAASWNACEHNAGTPGPKSGTDACNLLTSNSNVAPGDTIYLREGTYYPTGRNDCIHPGQSGTSGSRIVYANYNGESVTLDGTNNNYEAILFSPGWNTGNPGDGRSYITIRGIHFTQWNKLADLYYASYNEITDCDFSGHKGDGMTVTYIAFEISHTSTHNWIHENTWHTFGHFVDQDDGTILNIGFDVGGDTSNSGTNFNTVENNHFYSSGHHILGVNNGKYNVVRNNYLHNEGWSTTGACASWTTGTCGYRVMSMTDDSELPVAGSNLIENNNIAYGAQYGGPHLITGASGSGLTVHTDTNIVRYNRFFGNVSYGIRIGSSIAQGYGRHNHIYNNTIYYSGYNLDSWSVVNEDDVHLLDNLRCAFMLYRTSPDGHVEDNVVVNNLAHAIWSETNIHSGNNYYPAFFLGTTGQVNTVENNWGNTGSDIQNTPFEPYPDPMFVDPDISDPTALSLVNGEWVGKPDLSLQDSSPVIDQAAPLTQAIGAGSNATTLTVEDARYFQDGTWGSDLARTTLHADWIAIDSVNNVVEIHAVNYSTNTITLSSAMTWNDTAKIWLYKNSSGRQVLYGTAPDFGAHEYMPIVGIAPVKDWNFGKVNMKCHPNPFYHSSYIDFSLPAESHISIEVIDVHGRIITKVANGYFDSGNHSIQWNGKDDTNRELASGLYWVRLTSGKFVQINRQILLLR